MSMLTDFEKGLVLLCVLILAFFGYGTYIFLRDAPVPPHYAPMVIPGPVVIVDRLHYVDRRPGASGLPIESGFLKDFRPKHTSRVRCDAECMAYRRAYRNAARANVLLGEHRYREHA
jgi:hypothetical protein